MTPTPDERPRVEMYTTSWCPWCVRAKTLLAARGVEEVHEIDVEADVDGRAAMEARTGRRTVPQIFIGETHVGGFDDLAALDRSGDLENLLQG